MHHEPPPEGALLGAWEPPAVALAEGMAPREVRALFDEVTYAEGALTDGECAALAALFAASGRAVPVGVEGRPGWEDPRVGSRRATAWSPPLAEALWPRLRPLVPARREARDHTPTDWHHPTAHRRWRSVGLSPVLRFMAYSRGGRHHGHYDNAYDYGDGRRTLQSFVLYLTDVAPGAGGRTRFLRDGQEALPVWARDHGDWPREALAHEVLLGVTPRRGAALVFDHRRCHDIERYDGDAPRVIVRGDVVYRAER
ncbi:MAG: 2OG-Fe(II) oxygenase [Deltaproteobacteria bacterium]|nr:2OG-Fe(II) oxygenase [Deltaproteobacteria bacterium]